MISLIAWLAAFVVAITIHEASHAWAADRLGDPTPKMMGRLSLNPIVHYDRVGTTLLLMLVILRSFGLPVIPFGWAKPVRFDPYNLKNPRRDAALISLAGPASNLILATALALILRLLQTPFSPYAITLFLIPMISLNVVLAVFNLLPIHPLDGGKILVGVLPEKDARKVDLVLNRYGIFLLFLVIFPFGGTSILTMIISPALSLILGILIPGNALV